MQAGENNRSFPNILGNRCVKGSGGDSGSGRSETHSTSMDVAQTLAKLYAKHLKPLEVHTKFQQYHSPPMDASHFTAKPMILVLGQYSTGKTSFLKYLVQRDFPGMRIGPEPTTDGFVVLEYGPHEGTIPGNALVVDRSRPYGPLSKFGVNFMNRFQCSICKSDILKHITLIDTPGILAGSKQHSRGYDFAAVLNWFAERVDRILIIFDAHKLDISDELSNCIKALRGNEDKIRLILNKADAVNPQQLMNVYGALLWYLAKVFHTPEVVKVYTGSFWNEPLQHEDSRTLFEMERAALFNDLRRLPSNYAVRLLGDMVKRCRTVLVHAELVRALKHDWGLFSGEKRKAKILENIEHKYAMIARTQGVSLGDFPDPQVMKDLFKTTDFSRLPRYRKDLIDSAKRLLSTEIPPIMERINAENDSGLSPLEINCGILRLEEGISHIWDRSDDLTWGEMVGKGESLKKFNSLQPFDGKVDGKRAKALFLSSELPTSLLSAIWELSDVDNDGLLDEDEFALALYLIEKVATGGLDLPAELPLELLPPSKRALSFRSDVSHDQPESNLKKKSFKLKSLLSLKTKKKSSDSPQVSLKPPVDKQDASLEMRSAVPVSKHDEISDYDSSIFGGDHTSVEESACIARVDKMSSIEERNEEDVPMLSNVDYPTFIQSNSCLF